MESYKKNKTYPHHGQAQTLEVFKEVFFGIEDGMVSTLGSITGIAIGSNNKEIVILAGVVIIAVESISMGIGSYLSNYSQGEIEEEEKKEEREELRKFPEEEKEELYKSYLKTGWSNSLAEQMTEEASKNKELMLKEIITHELKIPDKQESSPILGGVSMFLSYILGGIIPLFSYTLLPIENAIPVSIVTTLLGLFLLGAGTAKFTKQPILKSSLRVLIIGGIALVIGLLAGMWIG